MSPLRTKRLLSAADTTPEDPTTPSDTVVTTSVCATAPVMITERLGQAEISQRPEGDYINQETRPTLIGRRLSQRTLFQYGSADARLFHGHSKRTQDFQHNVLDNVPWGDDHVAGQQATELGFFRILSHNVNGLSKANFHVDVVDFARAINDKAVGLFGIQETNRNFEKREMLDSFHRVLRSSSTHHHGAVSSAQLDLRSDHQPGGTAVSVRNQWASRFLDKGSDNLGRWSWLTLTGQGTIKITFISAYRVCDGAPESSITSRTARSQQEWMYAAQGLPPTNLRKQFTKDIITLILAFQRKGHDIVLMMDANEPSISGSAIDTIVISCGLIDAHTLTSATTTPPATYHRGTQKIDFILVSPRPSSAIRAASILALHDGYLSDHRALIVDFDAALLFSGNTSEIVPPSTRQLTSTNPKAVSAYVKHMLYHIAYHRIEERVARLTECSEQGIFGSEEILEWERVDDSLAQARRASEAKCPKKRTGLHPWSPEFDKATKFLLYWKLRMREFNSRTSHEKVLDNLASALQLEPDEIDWMTSSEVHARIQHARSKLRSVKKQAADLRDEHLADCAKLASALHNMSDAAATASIRSREKSSRQFRQLRSILKSSSASGLERIDVPNLQAVLRNGEATPRLQLVTKEEIEEVLVPHTELRFTQHQETPFGHGQRQQQLGIDCTSSHAEAIRRGTYDHELLALSDEAREWISQLASKDFTRTRDGLISTAISTDDVIRGWAKMRESTSSAPGGHYGHYKTASVAARLPEDHSDHTTLIAELYAKMWSLPLQHGFAPTRWCKCIDAILEKLPGKPVIEKLRIIMLYEADFNFVLKLIWGKRLVRHAEKHGCLGKSNHGSRSGRQTTDAQLEKLLLYDITRLTRTSLVTVDNDAKSCYDRIIKPLSMTACMAVGLPGNAATMHNNTHHRMEHRIKTRHGLLRPYSGTDVNPHEGTGQGSGASPAIWLIYMVTLLNAFARYSSGMTVSSPFQKDLTVFILAVFFVDDGMPGVNDASDTNARSLADLLTSAQNVSQSWERLLYVSGGALELTKCFTYVMYWDLSNGSHRLLLPDEIPGCSTLEGERFTGPISLTYGDKSPTRHLIDTVSPWCGRRTLGVRIAPAGCWTDELVYRKTQARELALLIAGSATTTGTARLGYHMMVCPKIEFPLTVTQFTQAECDSISASTIRACLSKMGYNCNMPREVVYGPPSMLGIGMHDLYVEQGIKQVSALVGHLRQDSDTGKMMQIELHWCQLQAGMHGSLLNNTEAPIDFIETCWIMGIRDFLRTYDFKIDLTEECTPHALQRVGDEFIMDAFRTRGDWTATQLIRLNACRLFLRVARLSDIASIDGKRIHVFTTKGQKDDNYSSNINWPRQGRPPQPWWNLWKLALKRIFSRDGNSLVLRTPLGGWLPSLKLEEWRVFSNTVHERTEVYERDPNGQFKKFVDTRDSTAVGTTRSMINTASYTYVDTLPFGTEPAEMGPIGKHKNRQVFTAPQLAVKACTTNDADGHAQSFAQYIGDQPPHIQQLMHDIDKSDEQAATVATLVSTCPTYHVGTDGGLAGNDGTFGFVIGDDQSIIAHGMGHTTGGGDSMSSTRAELSGILAALTYLRLVTAFTKTIVSESSMCILHCDSQAALSRVISLEYQGFGTTWRCRANYDLEVAIDFCMQQLSSTVKWEWVRGHAHRRKKEFDFTWPESLNSAADAMATKARQRAHLTNNQHWPEQAISIIGPQGRITGHLAKEIRHCCTSRDLQTYWTDRYNWTAQQATTVDVVALRSVAAKLTPASTQRMTKLRCGWLPVNSRVSRSDPDQPDGCPACSQNGLVSETVDHIFQCCATARKKTLRDAFTRLRSDFRALKTSDVIIAALKAGATAWIEEKEIPTVESLQLPDTEVGRLTGRAYAEQTALGWNVLFRGFWSHSWRLAQEVEFHTKQCYERTDTGKQWSTAVHVWFFELFESLWGLRNEDQHGNDADTERLIRVSKCERAIRRLYDKGKDLTYCERHPFRDPIEQLLSKPVLDQEQWISLTERYLPKAIRRIRKRGKDKQRALTEFFARRT